MLARAASSAANTCGKVRPPSLAHHHDGTAFARLVFGQPPIDPVARQVLRPDMAAEIGASISATRPSPPICSPLMLAAMASRSLCANTNAVLY